MLWYFKLKSNTKQTKSSHNVSDLNMFWQERHSQPIQQGIQPSLDLQDHLHKVNKNQSQGKLLIFKLASVFVKGSCWKGFLGHKIIGSLQMRVSKKQINKNPLRQQLKVMPLLVVNHSEIIITNWGHQKKNYVQSWDSLFFFRYYDSILDILLEPEWGLPCTFYHKSILSHPDAK